MSWIGGRPLLSSGTLLGAVFAASLALFLAGGMQSVRRVLFFPDAATHELVGEAHFIPRTRGAEESARELVKELLLGPAGFELVRLLPKTVDLRSVSLRERVLYVDFSTDLALDVGSGPLGLAEVVQGVANNLYFNFPRLRGVYIFIHGQIPELEEMDASRLAYSRDIVR